MAPSQLEIKTKALGRLIKEESLYQDELKAQEAHVEQLKSSGADQYDLKKQVEVLDDTKNVIPEIRKKIDEAQQSLEEFLKEYQGTEDLTASKENIELAQKILK
ncbi:Tubulin-specific chaperone A [Wickerhamomyces ciferrii]|uniref:Tubulin-specific chaperone A n=1 Tax=Wickerhamomyces ciferrii (strain ATCC 14091 / BCRC 22168 / CBS 111 / JCM 3599 / NBRC 0793 / NRRL Y-1031 F-60-10) TaxID=1206466 RepID=K0KNG6_WICCF|nr:Tubulin-specific chaperone A [Wickerhamomyces ciferrii]CCH42939.1 Tubulin-specific chaperone A [Wickerhamomyces ciferrii]